MESVFEEKQRFGSGWTIILFMPLGFISLLFIYGCYQQLIQGIPFGNNPAPDTLLVALTLLFMGLTASLAAMRLETRIDPWSAGFRWYPFMRKMRTINRVDLEKAELINYGFVGYGIRLSRHGWVHNTAGSKGLKLTKKNKRSIVLGTQKPEALEAYIQTYWKE